MRPIDADALIADMERTYCKDCNRRKGMKNGKMRFCYEIGDVPCRACDIECAKEDIDEAPTLDVAPVRHGR